MVDPHVEMLGTDAGVVSFQFRDAGRERIEGAVSFVFERVDGEIVHVHESGTTPE